MNRHPQESQQWIRFKDRLHRVLLGNRKHSGLLITALIYILLISIGFIFLYPILHMLVTSFMSLDDLLDDTVRWIPTYFSTENYKEAMAVMKFEERLVPSIVLAVGSALAQTAVCAVTGYGFSRYRFIGRKFFLVLVVLTYIIPAHVLLVPKYLLFSDYHLIGSMNVLFLPALFGQGLYSAIFILIFMQFFNQTPLALDEAARVDGAGEFRIFATIAIPLAGPAFLISILFSVVWYWNETYFSSMFLGGAGVGKASIRTILMELISFEDSYKSYMQKTAGSWAAGSSVDSVVNEAIVMAGTMLSIAPLLILYFILQRYFVESIDRTGITGE